MMSDNPFSWKLQLFYLDEGTQIAQKHGKCFHEFVVTRPDPKMLKPELKVK